MRIGITGITGLKNRGVEALLQPIVDGLKEIRPDSSITVFSRTPEYDKGHWKGAPCDWVPEFRNRAYEELSVKKCIKKTAHRVAEEYLGRERYPEYRAQDGLVLAGGDMLCYGIGIMGRVAGPLLEAARKGKPIALVGQSIGPFATEEEIDLFRRIYDAAALVSVRDRVSFDYINGALDLDSSKLRQIADSAFLLPAENSVLGWWHARFREDDRVIGIAPSVGIAGWSGLNADQHIDAWCGLLKLLLDERGFKVCLFAHVQDPNRSDLETCTEILRRMRFDARIDCAGLNLSAAENKALLGRCHLVLAERMHAAVGAYSMKVPAMIVGYSKKAEGMATEMLGREQAEEFGFFPVDELSESGRVLSRIDKLVARHPTVTSELEARVKSAVDSASRVFTELDSVFGN